MTCGRHAAVHFLSFPRAGKGRDKNNRNPNLVCEKIFSHSLKVLVSLQINWSKKNTIFSFHILNSIIA